MSGAMVDGHEPAVEPAPVTGPDSWTSLSADNAGTVTEGRPEAPAEAIAEPAVDRDDKGQFTSAKKANPRKDPHARVKDATADAARERTAREAAEAKAAAFEREIQALKTTPAPKAAVPATRQKPSVEDIGSGLKYATYEDYVEDLADWRFEQREATRAAEAAAKAEADSQTRQQAAVAERVTQIWARGAAAYPDFKAAIDGAAATPQFSPMHRLAVLKHPQAEAILYAMAKDPDLARRVAALDDPYDVGVLFATLTPPAAVARPDSAPTVRPSSAKPPINRVGGAANATATPPEDLEFGPDYIRTMNQQQKERTGRL